MGMTDAQRAAKRLRESTEEYRAARRARDARRKASRKDFYGQTEYALIVKPREDNKAKREGFKDASQKRRITKRAKTPDQIRSTLKRETLSYFGITEGQLLYFRIQNARHLAGEGNFNR